MLIKFHRDYLRSSLFGVEDALISTGGALVGIAVGSQDKRFVLLAGLVIILVESVSMAASEFSSEETVHQLDKKDKDNVFLSAIIMFCSYFTAGFIPVLPYILFPFPGSILISTLLSLTGLAFLGIYKGIISKTSLFKNSVEVLVIGGLASLVGVIAGYILKI